MSRCAWGITVALVGADGAGKTTLDRRLVANLPTVATCVYRGNNPASATGTRAVLLLGALTVLVVRVAEEANQLVRVRRKRRKGRSEVLDRYYRFDHYAHAIVGSGRGLLPGLHGTWLARAFPEPDLTVCLDAAPEILLSRKGEGDELTLARRRQEFLDLAAVPGFVLVDGGRRAAEVEREVLDLISSLSA